MEARTAYREGKLNREQLREIEDRSILEALELQKASGVDVFTDGEYRRSNFMADFISTLEGIVPSEAIMAPVWRGPHRDLASAVPRSDSEMVVGGKLRKRKPALFADEAAS